MAVEHSQEPRPHDERPGHGKQDSHQLRGDPAGLLPCPQHDQVGDPGREDHAEGAQKHRCGQHEAQHGGREAGRLLRGCTLLLEGLRIDGHERRGQSALSKQVPNDVGDLDGRPVGVGEQAGSQESCQGGVSGEARESTEEDSGSDGRGRPAAKRMALLVTKLICVPS